MQGQSKRVGRQIPSRQPLLSRMLLRSGREHCPKVWDVQRALAMTTRRTAIARGRPRSAVRTPTDTAGVCSMGFVER